jgi:hypothetical protein
MRRKAVHTGIAGKPREVLQREVTARCAELFLCTNLPAAGRAGVVRRQGVHSSIKRQATRGAAAICQAAEGNVTCGSGTAARGSWP